MLTVRGKHNGRQVFCSVVLMPIEQLDGIGLDISKEPNIQILTGLIDTGATTTSITPSAVAKLDLTPSGVRRVSHAAGSSLRSAYVFRVGFLNGNESAQNLLIPDEAVEGMELPYDALPFDVLIGMDILSQGKMILTNRSFEFQYNPLKI